jgi:cytoskeletal protein CcmA (bactofilin family)
MKGHRLLLGLKRLRDRFKDESGSALVTVVILGAAILIVVMALLSTVNTTNIINRNVDNSENAYLAARSGITMLTDAGADKDFAAKLVNSIDNASPIEMDFGDVGKCKVYVKDAGQDTDPNGIIIKKVKVECTGIYDSSEFTLSRYLTIKQTGTVNNSELKTCAYTHFGDGDMVIDGGIEGNVNIIGSGHITNEKANEDHPMHDVVCANELVLTNSGSVYDLIASGKYLYLGAVTVNTEVYVGSYLRDENDKKLDELRDDIYCYLDTSRVNSVVRCEGVTILGGSASINESNANASNTDVINPDQKAILSGGDLYLGYTLPSTSADTYKTGDSYKNPDSTVNTSLGLSTNNAGQDIYGSIVSGGDINIASTAKIYGDIIAKGDVNLNTNCTVYGKIYAGGNVTFSSGLNTSISGAFPNSDDRVIYAGGTITMNSPNIHKSDFEIHENASLVPNYSTYFNGSDFVAAASYFNDQYESTPKPTTNIPSRLYSLPETRQSDTNSVMVTQTCWYCTDPTYCPLDMSQTCWWCSDYDGSPYWVDVSWGRQHVQHQGVAAHQVHQVATTDPPTYQDVVTDVKKVHITSDTRLVGDINLPTDEYKLYIDCSPQDGSSTGQNIDILLQGNITIGNGGGIFINDNGGQNQIRIFMTEGSSISMQSGYGATYKGMYVISDDDADIDMDSLPSNSNGSCIDINKVPQLYIFGEEGVNNITLDVGTYGYIPGYVLTPYIDVQTSSNAHCYVNGSTLGKDPTNPSSDSPANYPFFYGMLMCNSLQFNQGTNTFVKYDWRLDDITVDVDGVLKTVKTETRKLFDQALARDNVMYFPDSEVVTDSTGSTDLAWVVTECF